MRQLDLFGVHDDEKALLASPEGLSAFRVMLPLIRKLAMAIAGIAPMPPEMDQLPDTKADVALERARFRALKARSP